MNKPVPAAPAQISDEPKHSWVPNVLRQWTHPCGYCGASAGSPCMNHAGTKPIKYVHLKRLEPVEAVSTTPKAHHLGFDVRKDDYTDEGQDYYVAEDVQPYLPKVSTPLPQHFLEYKEERNGWHYRTCFCGVEVGPFNLSDYADDAFLVHCGPALPQQEEPARIITQEQADEWNDMVDPDVYEGINREKWVPIVASPLLGQEEPAITDDLVESIQEVSKLRAELTQALTSLAAATARAEKAETTLATRNKWMHGRFDFVPRPTDPQRCGCAYCTGDNEALADCCAEQEMQLFLPGGWKDRAELAEASLAEAQKEIQELRHESRVYRGANIILAKDLVAAENKLEKEQYKGLER